MQPLPLRGWLRVLALWRAVAVSARPSGGVLDDDALLDRISACTGMPTPVCQSSRAGDSRHGLRAVGVSSSSGTAQSRCLRHS